MREPSKTTGKDIYRSKYREALNLQAEWLRRGASDKADSVELLIRRNKVPSRQMLEFGSGTGAVIEECERRGLSEKYVAIDYSTEAINYLRSRSKSIQTLVGDITTTNFALSEHFDIVIMSHVLEHLERPEEALQSAKRLDFAHLIVEVPLENLFFGRMKARFQNRSRNLAGHVQFFTASTFEALLKSCGLTILDRRRYVPIPTMDTIRFVSHKDGASYLRLLQRALTRRYLPTLTAPLWEKLYYAHYAVLCEANSE
jgi:SAM-dependent methyltransferase